jgi:hypothetical protein
MEIGVNWACKQVEETAAAAGLEYDMKSNPVSYFVRACIDERPDNVERTEEVLSAYMQYRKKSRLPTLTKKDFKERFIKACKEVGLSTNEKRHRPAGGAAKDRYYGFINVKVNKEDLKEYLGDLWEEPTNKKTEPGRDDPIIKSDSGQAEFNPEVTGRQPDRLFHTDMTTFLREHREEAFNDAHAAALSFCEVMGTGYKATYGLDFIVNEIQKRNDALEDIQKNSTAS